MVRNINSKSNVHFSNKLSFKLRKGDFVINSFEVPSLTQEVPPKLSPIKELGGASSGSDIPVRFSVRRRSSDYSLTPPTLRKARRASLPAQKHTRRPSLPVQTERYGILINPKWVCFGCRSKLKLFNKCQS